MSAMPRVCRALAVDDDRLDLEVLKRSFLKHAPDMALRTCSDSTEAVDLICEEETDLVLLDINMPGLDGFDVLKAARDRLAGTFPAVIVLSGSSQPEDRRDAYALGASAYVVKPPSLGGYNELAKSIAEFWGGQVARP